MPAPRTPDEQARANFQNVPYRSPEEEVRYPTTGLVNLGSAIALFSHTRLPEDLVAVCGGTRCQPVTWGIGNGQWRKRSKSFKAKRDTFIRLWGRATWRRYMVSPVRASFDRGDPRPTDISPLRYRVARMCLLSHLSGLSGRATLTRLNLPAEVRVTDPPGYSRSVECTRRQYSLFLH